MDSDTGMMTAAEMRERLIGKATRDDEFRARLVADPKDAIRNEWGMTFPDEFTIEVHEEAADTSHLVLPPPVALNEADLYRAAGGYSMPSPGTPNWQNHRTENGQMKKDW